MALLLSTEEIYVLIRDVIHDVVMIDLADDCGIDEPLGMDSLDLFEFVLEIEGQLDKRGIKVDLTKTPLLDGEDKTIQSELLTLANLAAYVAEAVDTFAETRARSSAGATTG